MSPEKALHEFLTEAVQAATHPSPLAGGVVVHETRYEVIKDELGIRIGDATSQIGPRAGETKEFNSEIMLEIFARVDDSKAAARDKVREIALAVAEKIQGDSNLDGRVCDCLVRLGSRGWARVATTPYAVQVLNLIVDPFGRSGG